MSRCPSALTALTALCLFAGCAERGEPTAAPPPPDNDTAGDVAYSGFVDLVWKPDDGRMLVAIDDFDTPFIYQSSLPRGVGSNDLGLDRGQLGATRLVRFVRSGPRVLLVEDNVAYRARSSDPDEVRAVEESFASSVIWGFDVVEERGDAVLIDGTDFFLRDAHGLGARLNKANEGEYSVDASRSAIYLPRTRAFPDNTEIEGIVTFTGKPTGTELATVAPDPTTFTVHVHHSFVRLPPDGYEPLPFDPRAGVIGLDYDSPGFLDYASTIGEPLYVNYGRRHRLEKQNPEADVSEPVEPIVYYVDRGAPEPIRSALIEGAGWWNDAFEAAGYRNAFEVRLLPEDADPMDVRYNTIQWVHRSTRGWSYGYSVLDPRTGEILKGHVTLGSLRVRQDYMIAEGLLSPYGDSAVPTTMLDMSLARIRQLSAHEVGHTLGFEHNFAASTQDRASVMDYPFPLIRFDDDGEIDLSQAYDTGIGEWDVRTVLYAYQDFPDGVDADEGRAAILEDTIESGLRYVAGADSRAVGTAHPYGNLWDNGDDAIAELEHLLAVRAHALERFSLANIRRGRPEATLEEVLVPLYLLHRFQIEAVGKLIGGAWFDYALRGDDHDGMRVVDEARQRAAMEALIATLDPEVLRLPEHVAMLIPPRPPGYPATRELFGGQTGHTFDPLAPAASSVALTLEVLLDPARAARMNRQQGPGFGELVEALLEATWFPPDRPVAPERYDPIALQTNTLVLDALMRLAVDDSADAAVRGTALAAVGRIETFASDPAGLVAADQRAQLEFALFRIARMRADPSSVLDAPRVPVPPGSPIGAGGP